MEELRLLTRPLGISGDDSDAMFRAGLTPSVALEAGNVGLSLKKVKEVFFTYGAQAILVIIEVVHSIKSAQR